MQLNMFLLPGPLAQIKFNNIPPLDYLAPTFPSYTTIFSMKYPTPEQAKSDVLVSMTIIDWDVALSHMLWLIFLSALIYSVNKRIRKYAPKDHVPDKISALKALYELSRVYANQVNITMSTDSTYMKGFILAHAIGFFYIFVCFGCMYSSDMVSLFKARTINTIEEASKSEMCPIFSTSDPIINDLKFATKGVKKALWNKFRKCNAISGKDGIVQQGSKPIVDAILDIVARKVMYFGPHTTESMWNHFYCATFDSKNPGGYELNKGEYLAEDVFSFLTVHGSNPLIHARLRRPIALLYESHLSWRSWSDLEVLLPPRGDSEDAKTCYHYREEALVPEYPRPIVPKDGRWLGLSLVCGCLLGSIFLLLEFVYKAFRKRVKRNRRNNRMKNRRNLIHLNQRQFIRQCKGLKTIQK